MMLENAMFLMAVVLPVIIGFSTTELFKAVTRGGAAAFLGVLIVSLILEGWEAPDAGMVQRLIFSNAAVVPQSMLLALLGHIARRCLDYVRNDHRPTQTQRRAMGSQRFH
jgi:hypothetical protein